MENRPGANGVTATLIAAGTAKSQVKTYAELRERTQKSPVTHRTSGAGSTLHLAGEQPSLQTGINWYSRS